MRDLKRFSVISFENCNDHPICSKGGNVSNELTIKKSLKIHLKFDDCFYHYKSNVILIITNFEWFYHKSSDLAAEFYGQTICSISNANFDKNYLIFQMVNLHNKLLEAVQNFGSKGDWGAIARTAVRTSVRI